MVGLKGALKPPQFQPSPWAGCHPPDQGDHTLSNLAWSTFRPQLPLYSTLFITSTSVQQVFPTREHKATPSARLGEANLAAARGIKVTFFAATTQQLPIDGANSYWILCFCAFRQHETGLGATHLPTAGTGRS